MLSTAAWAHPIDYDESVPCDPGGTPVCEWNGLFKRWDCDLSLIGEEGPVKAWMVYGGYGDFASDCDNVCHEDHPYCAWGEQDGVKFYCNLEASAGGLDLEVGQLSGTTGADTLHFWYHFVDPEAESSMDCWMQEHTEDERVTGKAIGNGGDDTIHGSSWESIHYHDLLAGDDDDDRIYGHDGDDELRGGSGDDLINGGAGVDEIHGDDDLDAITCGDGNDWASGGNGIDYLCGDNGDDVLLGNSGSDWLWGGPGTNDVANGGGVEPNACDAETEVNCSTYVDLRPPECPTDLIPTVYPE